ncbi:hypothetical protein F5Y12DRAFT_770775 [Xylaria sp. FL1777]|nr:hypothetical protein F5Y12DRAFT_770775 [Xylaria sp. FL1777]
MSLANNNDSNAKDDISPNDAVTPKTRARAHDMLAYSQRQFDRVVAPSTRQKAIDSITAFATRRPLLSVFIAIQILSALIPTLLFTTFVLSALVFALLSAIAFTLFWALVALLFLLPTLFLTCGFAVLVWLWAIGSYVVARTIYTRLPASVRQAVNPRGGEKRVIFSQNHNLDEAIAAEVAEARE